MQITRLRLLGFKSFVEPTELTIERGLTGVVGPNGCGKSNLLEALRWVMGETSHKSMRAAAMDDVIFSGTVGRPGRNSAEVTIFLDNRNRSAPAEFNDNDTIEITRRIEREAGSAYRISGKEARARDVKILFEDAATGARSPALVRQGQIAEIVNAKPEQRRRILEDAAGVAGLHSRRHEAELRLKAAENNLARLGDILGQLSGQVDALKRQSRQARRYKEISGEIRRAEAQLFHLQWAAAQARVDAEEAGLVEAVSLLGMATEQEAELLRREAELADAMDPLREEEARRAAALARLGVEQANFEREAERAAARQKEVEARKLQLTTDLAREQSLVTEARDMLERLAREVEALRAADEAAEREDKKLRSSLPPAEVALADIERELNDLTAAAFEARARKKSLEESLDERHNQIARFERQLVALDRQAQEIAARAPDAQKLAETSLAGQRLAEQLIRIESETVGVDEALRHAAAEAKAAREASQQADLAASQLTAELTTLTKLVLPPRTDGRPPVVEQIRVTPGYELALGAALGDDLDAPVADDAPVQWRHVDPHPDDARLPEGVEPLIGRVKGPRELMRRLLQVGIVARDQGARLQPALKPGQRLVSREGDLWRWDGFSAAAEAPTAAGLLLAERNRLADLFEREANARQEAAAAADAANVATGAHRRAEERERVLRQLWRTTQAELGRTREALTLIERAAHETEGKLATVNDARTRATESLNEARERAAEIEAMLGLIGNGEEHEEPLAAAQAETAVRRQHVTDLRTGLMGLERDARQRSERVAAADTEAQRWGARRDGAGQQIATISARLAENAAEMTALADLPKRIDEQRQKLMTGLAEAERHRREAADRLAAAENTRREAAQALRTMQGAVAEAREGRARIEAKLEAARARRADETRKIRDALGVAPDGCLALAEIAPGTVLPPLEDVDRQLTRLKADRERLGGVNLQAEEELQALQQQFESMERERTDVEEAIAKLRGGIGQLNREAKKRLNDAFTTVDGHFQRLFTTLFGGGEARLEMIEGEDPLEGGLEIIAKPPGKKPATLSLLSGGEQTLTALSLIFAVFLTNPSPICVLDEVDAPLDDANVDRFCTLMEKMADETATRFLVITHHPMTMARMNRLYGVTMAEKGVSQLVSVDLSTAEQFTSHAEQAQGAA
jgi:chromosome segregation protein